MTEWQTEKLSNLLAVSIGGIWGEEAGEAEVDVSVVRVTELKAHGRIDPSSAVTRSVTLKQLSSRELQEGDLLLEKSGGGPNTPVGRVGYFSQEGTRTVCSNFMQLMRPDSSKVLPKYLFLFLDGFHSNGGTIPMQTATTNIRNIKTPQYMDIEVPVPPIDEQYKIVELLEDHLSRLDATFTELKKTKLMCSTLLAASLKSIVESVPHEYRPLSDVVHKIEAGKSFSCLGRPAEGDEWGVIKVSAMTWGEFLSTENKAAPLSYNPPPQHKINKGDILISRANTQKYVGATVLVKNEPGRLLLSDKSLRIVPKSDTDATWLVAVLSSPKTRQAISNQATGNEDSMRNISQRNLLGIHVPVPRDLAGQLQVTNALALVESGIASNLKIIEQSLSRTLQFRRKLLYSAFVGQQSKEVVNV